MAAYKQKVVRYYNSKVRLIIFQQGDLVLQQTKVLQPIELGKLSPN